VGNKMQIKNIGSLKKTTSWLLMAMMIMMVMGGQAFAATLLSIDGSKFTTKTVGAARSAAWLLWSNGYIETSFNFPSSASYEFQVQAYGDMAGGIGPNMEIRMDQKVMKAVVVTSKTVQTYSVVVPVTQGLHKIQIAFTNDAIIAGQDRNLYVQHLNILSVTPPAPAFRFISNPVAVDMAQTSAAVQWSLSAAGTGQVEYGTSTAYGKLTTPELSFQYSSHRQNIAGLAPGTIYHYRVKSKNAAGAQIISPDFTFKTAGTAPAPIPEAPVCKLSSGNVTPVIASQAAWDAKFDSQYGATLPTLSGGAETFAWQGHYIVRAYVSMAKTYGSTKYLDRAVKTIDYWFAHQESAQGWGASLGPSQMMLDTGVIAQAIAIFSHSVWKDARFAAYRAKADSYIAKLEPILHTYDAQWVNNAPYPGSPGFYVYASCGGVCSPASLMMYNQGATMVKSLLLIDQIKRLKGQTPDPGYRAKAHAGAAYFLTFATPVGSAYTWNYGGARGNGVEDTSHGHLDLSLLVSAKKYGLGGLTDTHMYRLAGTLHRVLNGAAGSNDVSYRVDGTGTPANNFDRVSVGYDWIDLVDYEPALFDQTVRVFNTHMANPTSARFYLGWAEILRKRKCVE